MAQLPMPALPLIGQNILVFVTNITEIYRMYTIVNKAM